MSTDLFEAARQPQEPSRANKRRSAVVVLLCAVLLAGGLVGALTAVKGLFGKPALTDYPGPGSGRVEVTIDPGSSLGEIGRTLADRDVVATAKAFVDAAGRNKKAKSIAPGTYELRTKMKADDAVTYLIGTKHRLSLHVVIPEGYEAKQVVAALAKTGRIKAEDATAALKKAAGLKLPTYAGGKAEGFLFPATYDFEPGTTAEQALAAMVTRYKQAAKAVDLDTGATRLGKTPYEILIIASIIERESKRESEFGKVSRVIYNRLEQGRRLEMDSTVNYGRTDRKLHLLKTDLAIDGPYNTYRRTGLPPTPISNPGEAALRAALNPDDGDWLFFVSFANGKTVFTSSYEEHLALKEKADVAGQAEDAGQ